LKAGTLSAAALIATPYAYAYDMAAMAIPVAFLASDQIGEKLLRGEQTVMVALFGASLPVFLTLGKTPLGPLITLTLLCLILRRVLWSVPISAKPSVTSPPSGRVRKEVAPRSALDGID
jgi:hypothetical protein